MIRRKTFNPANVQGKWLVIVDGTELDEGLKQKNSSYLERCYNRGTEEEYIRYHRGVLEAKIYFGNGLVASIGTEAIENKWEYIIRYKEGCASTIEKEYQAIPEKTVVEKAEFVNEVIFKEGIVNMLKYKESRVKNGEEVTTAFAWITSFWITKKNALKLVGAGRNRWKIENQGFNRQKRWQGNIEHACSYNENAQKCHYLMEQIADFIKQLYEFFYLEKHEIKKVQKNISSDLLSSFGQQLTKEDISRNDMHGISVN